MVSLVVGRNGRDCPVVLHFPAKERRLDALLPTLALVRQEPLPPGISTVAARPSVRANRLLERYIVVYGASSPRSCDSALPAARCSASFLFRPQAGANRRLLISAAI